MTRRASLFIGTHSCPGGQAAEALLNLPGRVAGIGLLLLRFAVGLSVAIQGAYTLIAATGATIDAWVMGFVAIFIGAALLIGFLTPFAGVSSAIGNSAIGISLIVESGAVPARQGVGRDRLSRNVHCYCVAGSRRIFTGCTFIWAQGNRYSQRPSALASLI